MIFLRIVQVITKEFIAWNDHFELDTLVIVLLGYALKPKVAPDEAYNGEDIAKDLWIKHGPNLPHQYVELFEAGPIESPKNGILWTIIALPNGYVMKNKTANIIIYQSESSKETRTFENTNKKCGNILISSLYAVFLKVKELSFRAIYII